MSSRVTFVCKLQHMNDTKSVQSKVTEHPNTTNAVSSIMEGSGWRGGWMGGWISFPPFQSQR